MNQLTETNENAVPGDLPVLLSASRLSLKVGVSSRDLYRFAREGKLHPDALSFGTNTPLFAETRINELRRACKKLK